MPMLGQNRFGVELHAFDVQGFMPHTHDFVNVASLVLGPGGDFQAIRQAGLFDHKRMIASGGERIAQAFEHADVLVINR